MVCALHAISRSHARQRGWQEVRDKGQGAGMGQECNHGLIFVELGRGQGEGAGVGIERGLGGERGFCAAVG